MTKRLFKFGMVVSVLLLLRTTVACGSTWGIGDCENFSWSPDSQQIAFQTSEATYIMKADGSQKRRIDSSSQAKSYAFPVLVWSPNGQKILFSATERSKIDVHDYLYILTKLYVVATNGISSSKLLAHNSHFPQWSPDEKQIAFQSYQDEQSKISERNWKIYVMNADGSHPIKLTRNSSSGRKPLWSPDGKQILFVADVDLDENNTEIYVTNANGVGEPKKLKTGISPLWSPDGKRIAFFDKNFEVHVMNRDGSNDTRIDRLPTRPYSYGLQWLKSDERPWLWYVVCRYNGPDFSNDDCDLKIQVASSANSRQIRQVTFSHVGTPPILSPNGRKIGFLSRGFLYTVNRDSTGATQFCQFISK